MRLGSVFETLSVSGSEGFPPARIVRKPCVKIQSQRARSRAKSWPRGKESRWGRRYRVTIKFNASRSSRPTFLLIASVASGLRTES